MVTTNILDETGVREITDKLGCFSVVEYQRDISVTPETAQTAYFMSKMGCRKRQVVANINNQGIILQAGAMQVMSGNVNMNTNIKGAGDLFKKMIGSKVTKETIIKPRYFGSGQVILEPTYKYILLEDLSKWGGAITIEDGLFLACDDTVNLTITARSTFSSAVAGGEGLFNTTLVGQGIAVLESPVPLNELIIFDLKEDVVKIDGNMAIAWSPSLKFTVERSSKTLIGSAASGEGLVNVYRGTGRILMAPVT
jgi:uncharacterized protein (AIM24 family)